MKTKTLLLFLALFISSPLFAQYGATSGYCNLGATKAKTQGLNSTNTLQGIVPQCTVTVYLTGTTNLATIYSSATGASLANPFLAQFSGSYRFYSTPGVAIDISLSGGIPPNNYEFPQTVVDVTPFAVGSGAYVQINPTTTQNVTQPLSGPSGSPSYFELMGSPILSYASTATNQPLTAQMPTSGWTAYHAFGDSITFGTGASSFSTDYVSRIAASTGTTSSLSNYGVAGAGSCDIADQQVFQHENPGTTSTELVTQNGGTNDAQINVAESTFRACHQGTLSWMTIPSSYKYTGTRFGSLPSGWSLDTTYPVVTGVHSTTNGSTITFPLTTTFPSQGYFIWYRIISGDGGTFTYNSNLSGEGSVNAFPPVGTALGMTSTQSVGVVSIPAEQGAPADSYPVTITVTSPTGASNVVSILGVSVAPPPSTITPTSPAVWTMGVPRSYQNYPYNETSQVQFDDFNYYSEDDTRLLQGFGLNVNYVNVRSWWLSETYDTYLPNQLHPNDIGHQEIANAFLSPTAQAPYNPREFQLNGTNCVLGSDCLTDNQIITGNIQTITAATYTIQCSDSLLYMTGTVPQTLTTVAGCPQKIFYVYSVNPTTVTVNYTPEAALTLGEFQGTILENYGEDQYWFALQSSTTINGVNCPSYSNCVVPYSQASGISPLTAGATTVLSNSSCSPSSVCTYNLTRCLVNSSTAVGVPTITAVVVGTSFTVTSLSSTDTTVTGDLASVCWQIN